MHCAACPLHRRTLCRMDGCLAARTAATANREPHDDEVIDRQVARLDVEDGDILTVRTRSKLTAEKSKAWQEELLELCRSQGFRHVSVIILDDCSDLTIERPRKAPTGMQHQAARPPVKTSY